MRARMVPLLVRDGQVIEDLTIPLFHGSAIVGRVLDAHGDPVESAQVRVLRLPRGGRPMTAGQMQTNDLGEFRVPRLQPGRYLVQVRPQMHQSFNPNPSVVEVPLPQPVPTYYPGALDMSQAQPITLNRGETVAGLEVVLAEGMPTVVTGVVLRSDGEPVTSGSVNARVSGPEATGGYDNSGGTGIRQGGSFQLNLPPGEYTLDAQVVTRQGPGPMGPERSALRQHEDQRRGRVDRGDQHHGGPRRDGNRPGRLRGIDAAAAEPRAGARAVLQSRRPWVPVRTSHHRG